MNVIFPLIVTLSIVCLLFNSPNAMLETFDIATNKSIDLFITLIGVYAVWQGVSFLLEKSGISSSIARLLNKPIKKLFNNCSEQASYQISINLVSNALGLSGMATPAGIEGMKLLDEEGNNHAKTLLTVISSTSVQILPISVIQLLASYNQNPTTIVVVSLISTVFSTTVGILLCKVFK